MAGRPSSPSSYSGNPAPIDCSLPLFVAPLVQTRSHIEVHCRWHSLLACNGCQTRRSSNRLRSAPLASSWTVSERMSGGLAYVGIAHVLPGSCGRGSVEDWLSVDAMKKPPLPSSAVRRRSRIPAEVSLTSSEYRARFLVALLFHVSIPG